MTKITLADYKPDLRHWLVSNKHLDDKDRTICAERGAIISTRTGGPQVGDFAVLTDDSVVRFSQDWGDQIQVSSVEAGSFYLSRGGRARFSGGLQPAMPKALFRLHGPLWLGRFWFFHHDHWGAHNGIDVLVPCRVFREIAPEPDIDGRDEYLE
jgi:hypothetical protein